MSDEERYEQILLVLEDLEEMSYDCVILVEGRRDVTALNHLGIYGDFYTVQSSGGPLKAAEYVFSTKKKAVILTDWDRKGDIIASDLAIQLSALDIQYDLSVRDRLASLCRIDIKDVQSLDELVNRLAEMNIR
ncbi:MAG: toprim domain-containing protein [Candidatus Methanomethylophilaceae archaeon]|jgi:5S rRNA maturation endonuclease (ribonuclease M5)